VTQGHGLWSAVEGRNSKELRASDVDSAGRPVSTNYHVPFLWVGRFAQFGDEMCWPCFVLLPFLFPFLIILSSHIPVC
jgi:hypothetical protein